MKKRVVKLDQKALRGLIKEAIQGRQPGSPLFTPPPDKKRRLRENGTEDFPLIEELTEKFREHISREWHYSADDPSMAAAGPEAWDMQVDRATEAFMNEVAELIEQIEQKLIGGEFHY